MSAKLRTETNTRTVERAIRRAAQAQLIGYRHFQADFEHGQWWITDLDSGAQWSVQDDNSEWGFCFEQVSQGDEA
jgi:hypothetical protein